MNYAELFPKARCAASVTPPSGLKIECVTTCVGYADFLAYTLPINRQHFDKIVVATSPGDKATQKVCSYHGVQAVMTDEFQAQWEGRFCKGAGINAGLEALDRDAWVLHLDADVALPPNFRSVILEADLDPLMLYGADRAEFKSFEDWQRFIGQPESPVAGNGFFLDIEHHGQHLGTRVAFPHQGGYIPIGFFQLWHGQSGVKRYISGHSDAGREDSVFATLWPRRRRALIPEVVVYHLESESAPMGINWKGRKSKPFGIR